MQLQDDDNEQSQTSPIQRADDEKESQTLPVQREEEEKPQTLQRQDDDKEQTQTSSIQREEDEKDSQTLPIQNIQRGPDGGGHAPPNKGAASEAIHNKGAGERIRSDTREPLESTFGADLSDVRVHDDSQANEAALDLNAKAFTHKNDIWLGAGESQSDLGLMAHEATHVIQQNQDSHQQYVQHAAKETTASEKKSSPDEAAPGVLNLQGYSKLAPFEPPEPVKEWLEQQSGKRGKVNAKFGKMAQVP